VSFRHLLTSGERTPGRGREPEPNGKPYAPKSNPGVSGERFSDNSGVADLLDQFRRTVLRVPIALSTFHAVILSGS
jgi:hypothetical protein